MMKRENTLSEELAQKLSQIENWFTSIEGAIVAFSGGIDSTLVLYLARKFKGKSRAIGVISNSESLKAKDFKIAQDFCNQFDIQFEVIKTNELEDERYNSNPIDRCFFCKDHLFKDLSIISAKFPGFKVLSGTNFDDLGDYRPGINAAQKNEVLAPLVACKITKSDIREIAKYFELPNWNKPASPCLSSRIPYNQSVTIEKLKQIEQAEDILNDYGFEKVRLRHYGTFGRIEVQPEDLKKLLLVQNEVVSKITALGFERCEIDEEGLISGKLNRVINQ